MLPEASATISNSLDLLAFPLEVLSVLATFINGRDIARLWNCGCSRLNTNLGARGAVRKFSLELDPLFPSKWPSIIEHLPHISRIFIYAGGYTKHSLKYESFRLVTPPALRTLILDFRGSVTAFLESCLLSSSDFSTLETLRASDSLADLTEDDARVLKSLKSLTSLDLEFRYYGGAMTDFLPPNLTCLTLSAEHCDFVDLNLPNALLTFNCAIYDFNTIRNPLAFPPGLTKFCFRGHYQEFTAAEIALLPPGMTYLDVRMDLEIEATRTALPSTLQTLRMFYLPIDETTYNVAHYPRNLTAMDTHAAITIENVQFLPPRLTRLSEVTPDLRIIPKLPSGLTSLEFSDTLGPNIDDSMEPVLLPQSLTELTHISTSQLSRCILPATLKCLSVLGPNFSEHTRVLPVGLAKLTTQSFDSDSLIGLPRGLTILSKIRITLELVSQLPSTLTSLELYSIELESTEVLYRLPSGLDRLHLGATALEMPIDLRKAPSSLKYLSLALDAYQHGLGHAILTTLPRKLQVFYFIMESQTDLTDVQEEALRQLPPSLTYLSIPESPTILDISARPRYLPLHLKTVNCGRHVPW